MTIQDLLDKIAEIKEIADNPDVDYSSKSLQEIYKICKNIEIDYQIERRLNDHSKFTTGDS